MTSDHTTDFRRSFGRSPADGSASVLFLDVDGVLNRCGESNQGLESDKVALLKQIIAETGCRVVLSSTWRKHEHLMERITIMFESFGSRLLGATPILDSKTSGAWGSPIWIAPCRGKEITQWIRENGTPDRFVILDDDDDMIDLLPKLVHTNSFTGLTPDLAREVIRRLNAEVSQPASNHNQQSTE